MEINLSKNKSKFLIAISLLILLTVSSLYILTRLTEPERPTNKGQKPSGNLSSSFLYQETFYECSKEIPGEWTEARVGVQGENGYYFIPENQSDLEKYCRVNAVIEYRAVLDILKKEDVQKTIEKYDTTQAWVRALGHMYINDKAYLNRILPAYKDIKIDCIIVVHSPEGTRFFIENGEKHTSHDDHQYLEVDATEFLTSLNKAPDADVTNFWLSLH